MIRSINHLRSRLRESSNRTNRCTSSARLQKRRGLAARREGASMVEFALVVPLFVLILFSCLEFARLNMIRNLVQDAAYYSCRYCIVPGATEAEAVAEATRILDAMGTNGATVEINGGAGLDDDSSEITVRISVPISQNALVVSQFTDQMEFVAETSMRTERYDGFYDANQ